MWEPRVERYLGQKGPKNKDYVLSGSELGQGFRGGAARDFGDKRYLSAKGRRSINKKKRRGLWSGRNEESGLLPRSR